MRRAQFGLIFFIGLALVIVYLYASGSLPDLAMIREKRMIIEAFLMERPLFGVVIFSFMYILAVALSVPIATPLTLLAGFLFGAVLGTIVVVISATVGATALFLLVRFFFYDAAKRRFSSELRTLHDEFAENGFWDVLLLRLAPIVPFALINVASALFGTRTRDYILATLIGIIPFTFIYVLAGERLGEITSLRDVAAPKTLIIVTLIALFAFIPRIISRRRSARSRD